MSAPSPHELYEPAVCERLRSFPMEEAEKLVEQSLELWPAPPAEGSVSAQGPPAWMTRHLNAYADFTADWSDLSEEMVEDRLRAWLDFRNEVRELLAHFHVGRADPFLRDEDGNPTMQGGGHGKRRRTIPKPIREWVWERDGRVCQLCQAGQHDEAEVDLRIDHLLPTSASGPHMAWNLWILCHPCNQWKSNGLWPETLEEAFSRLKDVRERLDELDNAN